MHKHTAHAPQPLSHVALHKAHTVAPSVKSFLGPCPTFLSTVPFNSTGRLPAHMPHQQWLCTAAPQDRRRDQRRQQRRARLQRAWRVLRHRVPGAGGGRRGERGLRHPHARSPPLPCGFCQDGRVLRWGEVHERRRGGVISRAVCSALSDNGCLGLCHQRTKRRQYQQSGTPHIMCAPAASVALAVLPAAGITAPPSPSRPPSSWGMACICLAALCCHVVMRPCPSRIAWPTSQASRPSASSGSAWRVTRCGARTA